MTHPMSGNEPEPMAPCTPNEKNEVHEALSQDWPVVSVRWLDAEARGGPGWEDPEDMVEFALKPLAEVHTVGLLIHACDEFIALTESRGPDQMGGVHKIPRAWIVSMEMMVPSDESVPPTLSMEDASRDDARVG